MTPDIGIDLFAEATDRLFKNDFFNWSRELLDLPGRTVGLRMLGAEVLMTDDTDNLRTILSTKVSAVEPHYELFKYTDREVLRLGEGRCFPQDLV